MKQIIPYQPPPPMPSPLNMPTLLRVHVADVRRRRGTKAATAFALAAINAMRTNANVAYMRRHVGRPGIMALRALVTSFAMVVPVLFLALAGAALPMVTFLFCAVGIFAVAAALITYMQGGNAT